jgi:aspartate-semialdehyde dehydrogenase
MDVAVVGATGLVGQVMVRVLEERHFPVTTFYPVASEKSAGKELKFSGKIYRVIGNQECVSRKPDLAIFSAGASTSLRWAPEYAGAGTTVIDNSSAWRMDPEKKLVVPEINAGVLGPDDKIIANPNCSTIQLVLAIAPLHKAYNIRRMVVSTYQSVTGTGVRAVRQMENERAGITGEMAYPHPIDKNCLPHCDVFLENGYTKEEMKMVNETRKILDDYSIAVTVTAARIPTVGGHSESVNLEFDREYDLDEVRNILSHTAGVIVLDDPKNNIYPTPLQAQNRDEVFVGRLRRDESREKCLNMWVVSDNLRKGAATNAIQIGEYLHTTGLL